VAWLTMARVDVGTIVRLRAPTGRHERPSERRVRVDEEAHCGQESPRSRTRHEPATAPRPVFGGETSHVAQVSEHVHGHEDEPQDETGLVKLEHLAAPGGRTEQEKYSRREEDDCQHHHEWSDHSERDGWRPTAAILRRANVVASKAPRRAGDLHEYGGNHQHANEYVNGEQRVHAKNRDALDGEQHQEYQCG